jgi:hypothetical protein
MTMQYMKSESRRKVLRYRLEVLLGRQMSLSLAHAAKTTKTTSPVFRALSACRRARSKARGAKAFTIMKMKKSKKTKSLR